MRIIKFRGKDIETGEWVYGDLHVLCDRPHIHTEQTAYPYAGKRSFVDPETIGQFTGLTDKNGKEIYEGDIIRHKDMVKPYHVIYDEYQFSPNDGFRSLSYPKHWEVIGNIHDNPELIEKEGQQ